MSSTEVTIKGLLALLILVPIGVGIPSLRTAGIHRLFFAFLLIGLFSDLVMWMLLLLKKGEHLLTVFQVYSLLEACFFLLFLFLTSPTRLLRTINKTFLIAIVPFWLLCMFVYPLIVEGTGSAPFDTGYEVVVSFIAGFALLQRAEKSDKTLFDSISWFTLGIFFYCFCTFYIMAFIDTIITRQIWFLNNIINSITYVFYAIGFWQIGRSPGTRDHSHYS